MDFSSLRYFCVAEHKFIRYVINCVCFLNKVTPERLKSLNVSHKVLIYHNYKLIFEIRTYMQRRTNCSGNFLNKLYALEHFYSE